MKERPILFSGPMVRALLDGRKTQTRRVMKQAVGPSLSVGVDGATAVAELSWLYGDGPGHEVHERTQKVPCPYGAPGDHLWVRESFWGCDAPGYGDQPCVVYDEEHHRTHYRAAEVRPWARKFGRIPSIHMPRDCSRITLEVTGVRVERLQDISEADASAEGVQAGYGEPFDPAHTISDQRRFELVWKQIHDEASWNANPWVWIVEFKRIES